MSIADHFEQAPDARYIRDYDARMARRQLNLSIVLVAVIAFAAAALGVVVRFDPAATRAPGYATASMVGAQPASAPPAYVGKL